MEQNRSDGRVSHRWMRIAGVAALASGLIVAAGIAVPEPATAASGSVSGTVFLDVNFNGVRDGASGNIAAEPLVAGVQVTVTDVNGDPVGSATTDAQGAYAVDGGPAATSQVRVQFTLPDGLSDGPSGSDSGSTVQFVTLPGTANLAVTQAGSFNDDANPYIVLPSQRTPATMSAQAVDFPALPALFGYAYDATGRADDPNTPANPAGAPTTLATQAQIGNTWGTATYGANWALSAAFFRRATPLGPGDPTDPDPANRTGQIYLTDVAEATGGTPNGAPFVTIPNTGVSPRSSEAVGFDWFHDPQSFAATYRIGLGDIDMSADNTTLYAVNLNDRQLYAVPVTPGPTADAAPSAGTPVAIPIPLDLPNATQGCAEQDVRPFGLGEHAGTLYVTLTCTAESTQQASDLRGYVYAFDEATATFDLTKPALETSLVYDRGVGYTEEESDAEWLPWNNDFSVTVNPNGTVTQHGAQPMLSTITFDLDGNASLSIKDRNGDQGGYHLGSPVDLSDSTLYVAFGSGELLRFCGTPGSWVRESNGSCGGDTGAQVDGGFGPGNGLFYRSTFEQGGSQLHDQTMQGSAVQVPGFATIMATSTSPQTPNDVAGSGYLQGFNQQGTRTLSNTDGELVNWLMTDANYDIQDHLTNNGSFAKTGGIGDLSALLAEAPVEIGNRVWVDTNRNGQQDAGEAPIAGVTVNLYAVGGADPIATAVTDALGLYSFSNRPGASPDDANIHLGSLLASTAYTIKLDNPVDHQPGHPLANYTPTVPGAGTDRAIDSNGVPTPAGSIVTSVAQVTTPAPNAADRTFDFGFVQQHYDLMITKSLVTSGPYNPGSAVTYSLVVKNNGPDIARTGFTVTDKLPNGLTFGSPAATGTNWTCGAPSGQEVECTWNGSDLADQAAALPITINATVDAGVADGAVFVNYSVVEPSPNQGYPEDIPVGTNPDRYENGSNVPSQQFPSNNDDSKPITVTVIPETTTTTTTPPETTTTTTPPVTTVPDTTTPPVTTVPGTTLPPGGTTIPPQVLPPEAPGELPVTGGNTNGVTLLALGLLLLGLVGFVVSRRRRA
jgi:uncharacterized repeat protein (TIGR01451 family)/LPXTG-motif cell wall-anchored protein